MCNLILDKKEYLENTTVSGFVEYLKNVTSGKAKIECRYIPSKDKKTPFYANSIQEALNNYKWAGKNYTENKKVLDNLSKNLKIDLDSNNEYAVLVTCLKILEWGEVYRGAVGWLANIASNGLLIERLKKSIDLMEGSHLEQMNLFSQNGILRCDSGTTKIFSLGSNKSIIYDGRVACALGMLIIDYLTQSGFKTIPDELNILMDSPYNSNRNPSINEFKFVSKSAQKSKQKNHAISNILSNWIIEKVVSDQVFQWKCNGINVGSSLSNKMRALEAALFMIGYTSNRSKYLEEGYYLVMKK